jgi:hypothetical protein
MNKSSKDKDYFIVEFDIPPTKDYLYVVWNLHGIAIIRKLYIKH